MFKMTVKRSGTACLALLFAFLASAFTQEQAPSNRVRTSRSRADYPYTQCSGPSLKRSKASRISMDKVAS